MFNFTKPEKALTLVLRVHKYQKRKGDGVTPYAVHPIGVALILAKHTQDQDILSAAILHDVLEDTDYSPRKIGKIFGRRVLKLVKEVSDAKPNHPWDKRKDAYLKHLKRVSKEACLIACADKINNLWSIVGAYKKFGESIWKRFEAPKEKKIEFYESVCRLVEKRFPHPLQKELSRTLKEVKKIVRLK
jgi:(p)ppGpp synthase/HD superfamily hydrolase